MSERRKLPKGWRWSRLSDAVDVVIGGTPSRKNPSLWANPEFPWVTVGDLNGSEIFETKEKISVQGVAHSNAKQISIGTALVSFKLSLGKVGVAGTKLYTNEAVAALIPKMVHALNEYFFFLFQFIDLKEHSRDAVKGKVVNKEILEGISIPLPPLAVQERIVEVLQQADAIRRKRAEARRLADQILPAAFNNLFGDVTPSNSNFNVVCLGDVTDIKSGVTKGRRLHGKETVTVPYLRVANVQDGFLDLAEIKTIPVLPTDVEKFHLEDGDILMTEGGDPDKLGRGCIWRGQIDECIHQNHVFRVRTDRSRLLPGFLAALLRTSYAKGYFFQAAKRTSNLASINSTQVKNFTFPLPPMEMQRKFLLRVEQWDRAVSQSTEAIHLAERTFSVLLSHAFTGELTAEWEAANADWIVERQAFYERLPRLALLSLLLERRERAGRDAVTLITALMKYAFLAQMEGELSRRLYRFVPYHYGPCAMELYDDLKALAADGLIAVKNDAEEEKTRIILTDPDRAAALLDAEARKDDALLAALEDVQKDPDAEIDPAAARLLKRRAEILETLRTDAATILDTYGDLDHNALLKAVYEKYPAYAKKSRLRRKRG